MTWITGAMIGELINPDPMDGRDAVTTYIIHQCNLATSEWLDPDAGDERHKYSLGAQVYGYSASDTATMDLTVYDGTNSWQVFDGTIGIVSGDYPTGNWEVAPLDGTSVCPEYPDAHTAYPDPDLVESTAAPSRPAPLCLRVAMRNVGERTVNGDLVYYGIRVREMHDLGYDDGRTLESGRFAEVCNRVTAGKSPAEDYRAASSWMASRVMAHSLNRLMRAARSDVCVPLISRTYEPPT